MRTPVRFCCRVTLVSLLAMLCSAPYQASALVGIIIFYTNTTVTTTNDDGTPGTLRYAISSANVTGSNVVFNILPGSTPYKITPETALPPIYGSYQIDGYTEPGARPNTLTNGDNAVLLIELDGSFFASHNVYTNGLTITGTNCIVRGLVISGLATNGDGIHVSGANNRIEGNFIGTTRDGTDTNGNSNGVVVDGNGNTVGGTTAAARNLISGNQGYGIEIFGNSNTVQGNFVGTDSTGLNALANQGAGVTVSINSNTIGGTISGARNVISGNGFDGVDLFSDGNTLQGNLIGIDVNGTGALPNGAHGVFVHGANNNIGGTTSGSGNVISGNGGNGIDIFGVRFSAAGFNVVQGNFIGTDMSGTKPLPNLGDGVLVSGGNSNTIGGTTSGTTNVVSGNLGNGIDIAGYFPPGCDCTPLPADFNMVLGNVIGTDLTGTRNLSNSLSGVLIDGTGTETSSNIVGGTNAEEGNVIAFNGSNGVTVVGVNAFGDSILGNSIFTNAALGIDLGAGANNSQNFPVLTSATCSNGNTVVQGTMSNTGSGTANVRIEFFANTACDPSGFGEGENFLGFVNVTVPITNPVPLVTFTNTDLEGLYITATATDDSGDTSEFSKCLQVTKLPPVITQCATSIVATADANCHATVPNFTSQVQATDNCTPSSMLVISQSPTNGAVVGVGITHVTITVADSSTNTTTCSVTFTVLDKTPPTITCPAPLTVECASAVPAPQPSSVVATDTCGAVTVTFISDTITNQTCTNRFTLIRTYRATDASSNTVDCQQTITVNSTTPPAINCPADVTTNTDLGQCSASGVALGSPTASSNCGDAVTVVNDAPSAFPKGTNTVVWTATDSCGNSSTCTQQVIVVDTQPPVFGTISPVTFTGALGSVSNAVTFATPTATDNCSTSVTVVCAPPSGSFFLYGTNPVTCVATDADGNTISNSFHVIVVRPVGPDLTGQWIATTTFSRGRNNFIFGAFQVINQGSARAPQSLLRFFRSTSGSTNDGTLLNTKVTVKSLPAGGAASVSIFGLKLPAGVSGTNQFLIAVVDANKTVLESDEENNVISTNPPAFFSSAGTALARFHKAIRQAKRKH